MRFLQYIKTILSSRQASVIVFLLAVAGRVIQKIYLISPLGDKAAQLFATKNFVNGHGVSTLEVLSTNLANAQYVPLIKWPPGYSFLMAPFYSLFGEDFIWGSLWPDLIVVIVFVWFARKTIKLFNVPVYLVNFYTLLTGFCLYSFTSSSSSDPAAAMFYQIALFLTLRFILSERKTYISAFLIALVLFACGLTRYLCIPVAFIIPLYFIASGYVNHNRKFVLSGFFMLAVLTVLTAMLLGIQNSYGGSPAYVMPSEKGFYPENLLDTTPFIFSSLFNINFFCVQVSNLSGLSFSAIGHALTNIHHIVLIITFVFSLNWLRKKKLVKPTLFEHFIYIGLFSTATLVAVLSYLSVTNAYILISDIDTWTFLQEGRYYFIPILFVQLFILISAWQHRNWIKKIQSRFLFFCTTILLCYMAHSVYYTAKLVIPFGKPIYKQAHEYVVMDYFHSFLDKLIKENRDKNIVVSSVDDSYTYYAGLWFDLPGLADYRKLNSLEIATGKETIIVVVLSDNLKKRLVEFTSNPKVKQVGEIYSYKLYTLNVSPVNQ